MAKGFHLQVEIKFRYSSIYYLLVLYGVVYLCIEQLGDLVVDTYFAFKGITRELVESLAQGMCV